MPELRDLLRKEVTGPIGPEIAAVTEKAWRRHGQNACAVLYYGSCLRRGYRDDDVVDLYLVVEQYRRGPVSRVNAYLNWLLPPNVAYVEAVVDGRIVRAKCAIISRGDFERGVSGRWFHSYMWARFAQPCRLAYVRDDDVMEHILDALEGAVRTMVQETHPLMTEPFDGASLWRRALEETYRAELRAEKPGRAYDLVVNDKDRYEKFSALLSGAGALEKVIEHGLAGPKYQPIGSLSKRARAHIRWFLRRVVGKFLSVLRLIKAAYTFDDGAVYILWKIERHSGVSVDLSDWQKRHPILASTTLVWRLYRRGAFR